MLTINSRKTAEDDNFDILAEFEAGISPLAVVEKTLEVVAEETLEVFVEDVVVVKVAVVDVVVEVVAEVIGVEATGWKIWQQIINMNDFFFKLSLIYF